MCGNTCPSNDENCKAMAKLSYHMWSTFRKTRTAWYPSFYDSDKNMVHSYTDKHSEFRLKVMIVDAPKDVTTWSLIGVDDDNWWNEFPPGKDCSRIRI